MAEPNAITSTSSPPRAKRFQSLTATVALAFLFANLLVLLVSTAFQVYFSIQTEQQLVLNQQALISRDAANAVRDFINEQFRVIDQAGDINDLGTFEDRRALVLDKLMGRDRAFRQLFLLSGDGTQQIQTSRLSTLTTNPIPTYHTDILAATLAGKQYISPVYIDAQTGEPLVLIAVPTRDIYHDPQGAFVAEVTIKSMWDLVGDIHVGQRGHAYVVDKRGSLIAYSDASRALKHEDLRALPEVAAFVQGSASPIGGITRGIDGTYVVSSFVPLGSPEWAVVTEVPLSEAYAPVAQVLLVAVLVMLVSLVFAVVLGGYLSRRITAGIQSLSKAANELSAGNLDARVSALPNNEIGRVGTSFNSMAERLQKLYEQMDLKIREKTASLSEQVAEGQKSKMAILNLLEDIEEEKEKVEQIVVDRTKELLDEKARLLASINSLSFGFLIADIDDKILIKNPAIMKILDLKEAPLSIGDIAESFRGVAAGLDVLTHSCRECVELRQVVELKDVLYGKKYLRIFCTPISSKDSGETNAHDVIIGYAMLVEDVTEMKIQERSRDEFFAVASHELRTPLTAIRGNADMLLEAYADKIVDADMKEMLSDIDASSVRLISIVNDFLEVSRLEQGKIIIEKEYFNLVDVIQKVVRDLHVPIEQKGVALVFSPPTVALPQAYADKNRVEQILVNLVGNATKFTKQGSITIDVSLADRFLKLRVTDTGIGISPQNQSLLFRKFQQAGEKVLARDITQGTGLGLYICMLLVSSMGGTIGLERSDLGKGSTFTFTVPTFE